MSALASGYWTATVALDPGNHLQFDVVGMKGVAVECRREPEIQAELAVDVARRQSAEHELAERFCDLDPSDQTAARVGSAGSRVRWGRAAARRFEAFNSLWEDHAAAVHASARLMCGLARADEVTHLIFVDVWSRPGRLDVSDDTIRTQMIVAVYRHAEHHSELAQHRLRRRSGVTHRRPMSPFKGFRETESRADILNNAVDGDLLSVRERCALALVLIGGCSSHDVARLLGDSEADTLSQLGSAMRRLRTHLLEAETSRP